jgi:hypothetical protein
VACRHHTFHQELPRRCQTPLPQPALLLAVRTTGQRRHVEPGDVIESMARQLDLKVRDRSIEGPCRGNNGHYDEWEGGSPWGKERASTSTFSRIQVHWSLRSAWAVTACKQDQQLVRPP